MLYDTTGPESATVLPHHKPSEGPSSSGRATTERRALRAEVTRRRYAPEEPARSRKQHCRVLPALVDGPVAIAMPLKRLAEGGSIEMGSRNPRSRPSTVRSPRGKVRPGDRT